MPLERGRRSYREAAATAVEPAAPISSPAISPRSFIPAYGSKNFALNRLAKQHGAAPVNLVVDSDTFTARAPRADGLVREATVPADRLDRPAPAIPYEERAIEDRELFAAFGPA